MIGYCESWALTHLFNTLHFWLIITPEEFKWFWLNVGTFFFFLFMAVPMAYGSSQARGWIGAAAVGQPHNHSKAKSEPCLQPTWLHWILNPLSEARDQTHVLMDANCWTMMGTPKCYSLLITVYPLSLCNALPCLLLQYLSYSLIWVLLSQIFFFSFCMEFFYYPFNFSLRVSLDLSWVF